MVTVQPGAVFWRRRAAALAVLALLVLIPLLLLTTAGGGGDDDGASADRASAAGAAKGKSAAERPQLPRGGRSIFPESRVVAFYGAPQDDELGVLGIGTPTRAARKLATVTKQYGRRSRPAIPAMELIAVVAAAHPGEGDRYNLRQPDAVIERYLKAARKAKALLLLDIQPGHADFLDEAMRLEKWLKEPDVGLALDPEWATPGAVPGTKIGTVDAKVVNAVSAWLDRIVQRGDLPQKLFVVHHFTGDMITNRQRLKQRDGLEITLNVDGFGDRPNKLAKYRAFTSHAVRFHDGFKLFYKEDTNLMSPGAVLDLRPPPDFVVYE